MIKRGTNMYQEITIQFTEQCNASCPYCFAPIKSYNVLSDIDFNVFHSFCENQSLNVIHVTGGEPSLHPNFGKYINRLADVGSLVIYSNLLTENMMSDINVKNPSEVVFLFNTNSENFCYASDKKNVKKNLEEALVKGIRIALSRTFYEQSIPMEDTFASLFDRMQKYKLTHLRLSQAIAFEKSQTGLDRNEIKELYHYVAQNICNWKKNGWSVYFDCPVPPCYIDNKDFNLLRENKAVSIKCRPKVFVMWNLDVTHCYSTMREATKKLTSFENICSAKEYSKSILKQRQEQSNRKGCYQCFHGKDGIPCGCPSYCV